MAGALFCCDCRPTGALFRTRLLPSTAAQKRGGWQRKAALDGRAAARQTAPRAGEGAEEDAGAQTYDVGADFLDEGKGAAASAGDRAGTALGALCRGHCSRGAGSGGGG